MNEYLIDLLEAFTNVDQRYYFAEVFKNLDNYHYDQEAVQQTTENSLSAELFANWRIIMRENPERYLDLALDFDVRKDWFDRDIFTRNIRSYRPDLVLHFSQLNWEPEFQKVYVEVKTSRTPYVQDDIRKLINAQTRLQFGSGVFISVNSDLAVLTDLLRNIRNSETSRLSHFRLNIDWNRIFLLHSVINEDNNKEITGLIPFSQL